MTNEKLTCFEQYKKTNYVPYTLNTVPCEIIFIKHKDSRERLLVLGLLKRGIQVYGHFYSYSHIFSDYEISLDNCQTWQPAGRRLECSTTWKSKYD